MSLCTVNEIKIYIFVIMASVVFKLTRSALHNSRLFLRTTAAASQNKTCKYTNLIPTISK